jgi:HAE1 family hydrophobic/amphiphilic exporter-1
MKNILGLFIRRPIFTAMLMVALAVFGLNAYPKIGVDQFPKVDLPVVTITTALPGADPDAIEKKVSKPLEEALNTLSGVDKMRSENLEGVSQIFLTFTLETKIDVAAQDVRDRVEATLSKLPKEIDTPVVEKVDIGASPVFTLALSGPMPPQELTRIAKDVVKPALQRQAGVGSITLVGGREREISVLLDPERLRSYGLAVGDVARAVKAQSIDQPGGRATQSQQERIVRLTSEAKSVADLRGLILSNQNGAPIRLLDVAEVIDGPEEARSSAVFQQRRAVALVVRKQSGSNTVAVAEAVRRSLADLAGTLPPGLTLDPVTDGSRSIRASIDAVNEDLVLGAALAVLIVLVFLRNLRSTFVAAIALPVSLIGTFAVMNALDFTFNVVTMLALTLSIGLLIDDAIVVIENIVRHIEEGQSPWDAALEGTSQLVVAVLAVTMAIVAVFIPVAFMKGLIGQFFYQFGVTVAVAVLISYAVSMSLTPMLSSRLLRANHPAGPGSDGPVSGGPFARLSRLLGWLSGGVERALQATERGYRRALGAILDRRALTVGVAVALLLGTLALARRLNFTFIPSQDTSQVLVTVELPIGSTIGRTEMEVASLARQIRAMPGVVTTFATVGGGVREEVHKGEVTVNLTEMKRRSFNQQQFKDQLRRELRPSGDVKLGVQDPAQVAGGGNRNQEVQFNLRGDDWSELLAASEKVRAAMKANPGFTDVDLTYRSGKPQLDVRIDRERAAQFGIRAGDVGDTLRSFLGQDKVADYREGGDTHDIKLHLPAETLASSAALEQLTIRAPDGQLVELRNLAAIVPAQGPVEIDRQGQKRQITLLANVAASFSLDQAVSFLGNFAQRELPPTVIHDFEGNAKNLADSTAAFVSALLLGVMLLYIILAAQFESLVHPFTIMVSLPFALIGAIGALLLSGQSMSMFALIGIIMLMGLVVKNSILLVDFTQQQRETGKSAREALLAAAPVRLRPILMTTVAMIAGMIPVALARGDGAETRVPMALVIIGGLVTSTLLTLGMVPVAYALVDALTQRLGRSRAAVARSEPSRAAAPGAGTIPMMPSHADGTPVG